MKPIITFLLLIYTFVIGYGQGYKPFPTSNAMWREHCVMVDYNGYQCWDRHYTITGDTIINSLTYHKLQETVKTMISNLGCNPWYGLVFSHYVGCFRNDSANKIVYFIPSSNPCGGPPTEMVLYTFNLSVGDTLPPTYLTALDCYPPRIYTVTAIDTVLLGGIYRKRFSIGNCDIPSGPTLYYIEGIGSTYGLLAFSDCPFEYMCELECFTENSLPVYPNETTTCSMVTSINEPAPSNQFSVFPNPASETLYINTNIQSYDINIFNSMGQLIRKENIFDGSTKLDISALPRGLLLIQIFKGNVELYKEKIIRE